MPLRELAIGPIALPGGVWLTLLMLIVASMVWFGFERAARGQHAASMAEPVFPLAGFALLGARIGFVLLYLDAYLEAPWSMLDLRDGGWHAPSGLIALTLGVGILAWWRPDRRRALLFTAGSTGLVTALAVAVVLTLTPAAPRQLPRLPLVTAEGRLISFPAQRPMVLNLWASWCAPCRREMPTLIRAAENHPEVDIVLLNQGEQAADIDHVRRAFGIPDELMAWDPEASASAALQVRGYPVTLFVDRSGHVVHRHFGALSAGSLAARIAALNAAD